MIRGLTSPIWPIHYKPLPDELLSSWLVRLAHGHGLKVQTFCNLIFGNNQQVWNRDIDRLAPTWLLGQLSYRTGAAPEIVWNTTLRAYEGLLYGKFRMSGTLPWILALKMYHRKREGYGLQFCPTCLAEDAIPYFRKRWRIAFNTLCLQHKSMLLDRCPKCSMAVAIHRVDMIRSQLTEITPVCCCHECGYDFRQAPKISISSYDHQALSLLLDANRMIHDDFREDQRWRLEHYEVMRQLCRVMTTRYKHVFLRKFVLEQLEAPDLPLTEGRISFEMRPIQERHHLVQLTSWLLVDLKPRITAAWLSHAVRYSVLLKDFEDAPKWYLEIARDLSNWRDRLL